MRYQPQTPYKPDPFLCAKCGKDNATHGIDGRYWHWDCLPKSLWQQRAPR